MLEVLDARLYTLPQSKRRPKGIVWSKGNLQRLLKGTDRKRSGWDVCSKKMFHILCLSGFRTFSRTMLINCSLDWTKIHRIPLGIRSGLLEGTYTQVANLLRAAFTVERNFTYLFVNYSNVRWLQAIRLYIGGWGSLLLFGVLQLKMLDDGSLMVYFAARKAWGSYSSSCQTRRNMVQAEIFDNDWHT